MTRRVNREGTYKKRSDGRVEGQVAFVDASGHRTRRSVYGKTVIDARRKIRELVDKVDAGIETKAKPQTMAEFLRSWARSSYTSKGVAIKPSTRASRDLNVRRILPHIGSVLLTKLAPAHIRKVDDELAAAGLSGSSRRQAYGVLKAALHQAVLDRLIVASPFTYVPWSPPVEEKEMGFLSALDQARLYALNDEWTALWQFFVATGLRSAECFGLSWRQVDLEGARLTVNQTLWRTPGGWELTSPKTKNSRRTLQLAAEVVEILRTVKSRQAAEAHRLGDSWVNPDEFVFTREAGQPLASYFVSHRLKKSLDAAGVKRCRVHDLRHTFAANHIGGGTPALALSRMLGHASVAFTLQRYGHLHVEVEDAAASLSGRLLEEARRFGETLRPVEVA